MGSSITVLDESSCSCLLGGVGMFSKSCESTKGSSRSGCIIVSCCVRMLQLWVGHPVLLEPCAPHSFVMGVCAAGLLCCVAQWPRPRHTAVYVPADVVVATAVYFLLPFCPSCSVSMTLSNQAPGCEVQMATNSLRGPSLRVRLTTGISARSYGYTVGLQYNVLLGASALLCKSVLFWLVGALRYVCSVLTGYITCITFLPTHRITIQRR